MVCYHPLKGFYLGINPKTGNPQYKIVPYRVSHIVRLHDGSFKYLFSDDPDRKVDDTKLKIYKGSDVLSDFVEVPCGKCIGCRLKYSADWAGRMMLETQYHENSWFVTLTYNNDYVPRSEDPVVDVNTGEKYYNFTLSKRDVQLFIKRLRSKLERDGRPQIRYYLCGEYGSETFRPHYHLIIFGLELYDLVFLKKGSKGFNFYTSKYLEDVWSERKDSKVFPIGHVMVGEVSFESCAYVARYITKKLNGDMARFYDENHIDPEFCLMSRKPGIAKKYFDDNLDAVFRHDSFYLPTAKGGKKLKPFKYFKRLYEDTRPDEYSLYKDRMASLSAEAKKLKVASSQLPYLQQLEVSERLLKKRTSILKNRNGEKGGFNNEKKGSKRQEDVF